MDKTDKGEHFRFSGALTVYLLNNVEKTVREAVNQAAGQVEIDVSAVTRLDTAGALLINQAAENIRKRGLDCAVRICGESHSKLLEKARFSPDKHDAPAQKHPLCLIVPNAIGKMLCERITLLGNFIGFMGKFLVDIAGLLLKPRRMRWTSLIFHMEQAGIRAVPIVSLLSLLIGMVVAYMGMEQLDKFGARIFAVRLLEVTVLREMAVLITAIVVAGRSSSSFTAQIGAMVANEEIAAMRSMGLDPALLLVVPRVLALILCLPMLVFVADIAALAGGGAAIWFVGGLDPHAFIGELYNTMDVCNFLVGIAKAPFFAMAIGLVGCFQGFRATSSAESVGFLTTVSVVQAIFIVILLNAVFAIFFAAMGI